MKKNIRQVSKIKLSSFIVIGTITGIIIILFAFAPIQKKQQRWTAPPSADKIINPVVSDAKSLAAGKILYTKNCYDCHGKKGKGDGPKSVELDKPAGDFTKEIFRKQTDGAIFWKITEGRKPMASFKKDLTEEQRWQVINYMRTLVK